MKENGKHPATNVLYVAYPLLTVSCDSAGGAEQVLWTLEREMAMRGVETVAAASAGSQVTGHLFATGDPCTQTDDLERRNREHQDRIVEFVHKCSRAGHPFSLIHDQSGSFWPRAVEIDLPVLVTLHLPRSFYPPHYFETVPANVSFNCVSVSQARDFADLPGFRGVVPNGIALELFEEGDSMDHHPREGLLWMGRICEEKAPHLALDIAQATGLPITLAGQVYPFSYHEEYFEREVAPRLRQTNHATFVPLPVHSRKRLLLREARALLITSQVDETSSLVAMEAAASGTPVIALARGALPEIVQDGITGLLVDTAADAVSAVSRVADIRPAECMRVARENFSSTAMAAGYAALYAQVVAEPSCPLAAR
jgi:glycosyltransferase involved in cell wall biosynthesis